MRPLEENDIKAALRSLEQKPSSEWQEKTKSLIRELRSEEDETLHEENHNQFSFSDFLRNAMKQFAFPVLSVLVIGIGLSYFSPKSAPSAFEIHIQNAEKALAKIESFANGKEIAAPPSFFPKASAEANSSEEKVAELVATIRIETESAVREIEVMNDAELILDALAEVDLLQERTVDVVSDALLRLENEIVIEDVVFTLEITTEQNAKVENSLRKIANEPKDGKKIAFHLESENAQDSAEASTTMSMSMKFTDESPEEMKQENFILQIETAKELIANIEIPQEKFHGKAEKKWEKLQDIFDACEGDNDDEKCQAGKAKGLAIALNAKARNDKRAEKRDDKNGRGQNRKGNDAEFPQEIMMPNTDDDGRVLEDAEEDRLNDSNEDGDDVQEEADDSEGRDRESESEDGEDDLLNLNAEVEISGEVQLR